MSQLKANVSIIMLKCQIVKFSTICKIVNCLLTHCQVSVSLKVANITPTLKKADSDTEELKSFRPVSNLCFISTISEEVVAIQLHNLIITWKNHI